MRGAPEHGAEPAALFVDPAPPRPHDQPLAVRGDRLLALYAIVPLVAAFVAIDLGLLGGALRAAIPGHPDAILFFTVVFNLPHVVASHLVFLDREYVGHYRRHLLGFGVALLAVSLAVAASSPPLLGILALLATYIHIIAQQAGLTGVQLLAFGPGFRAWKWLTIAIGVIGYYPHPALVLVAALLGVPWFVLAIRLHRRATRGRLYLWANQALFTGMFACWALGYPLLALLMPRVVHDLSAFYVYGVHDRNRNHLRPITPIYRAAAALRVPTWIAGPLAAIVIASLIELLPEPGAWLVVYVLSAYHYYLEAIVWRRGSPHRRWTPFG